MGLAFIRVIQIGIKSLMLHKMRSLLTMMGIIFGVCSVIAMLAIGAALEHSGAVVLIAGGLAPYLAILPGF